MLDRSSIVLDVAGQRVAIAGTKGFGGGYDAALADDFGEPEMKAWIRHAEAEAETLEDILTALVGDVRIVLLHYAPIPETLDGERLELYPFLGNSMLGEAIDRSGADLVLHGHAHHGSLAGTTHGGVPVRNVAQSVIRGPYVVFTIEREDENRPGRSLRRRRGDGDGGCPRRRPGARAREQTAALAAARHPHRRPRSTGPEGQAPLSPVRHQYLPSWRPCTTRGGSALTLLDLLEAVTTALGTYPLVVVATTPATDARVTTRLEQLGAHVVPGGQAGEGRRAALTAARERSARLFLL